MGNRSKLIAAIIDDIEVPQHAYDLARSRHRSIGEWLNRAGSSIAHLSPHLYPQGSFRLGTAVKPIDGRVGYDVDQVCELLRATKVRYTQAQVKALVLAELIAYATAYSFKDRPKNGHRCVTLEYADPAPLRFHFDELPCVPEDMAVKVALAMALAEDGLPETLAKTAVAITDDRHWGFGVITPDWHSSNPRGYADWFAERMRAAALDQLRSLVAKGMFASVDEVPEFLWKTPLQRVVQLLKRHRDVHFLDAPELRPISIIVTTLAAQAYDGETDLATALDGIVGRMSALRAPTIAHLRNPVNRKEVFTEKWDGNPLLRHAFTGWMEQLRADVHHLVHGNDLAGLRAVAGGRLRVSAAEDKIASLAGLRARPAAVARGIAAAPGLVLPVRSGPPPWGTKPR